MRGHPDDIALDACRAGEAEPELERHVASCPKCQQRLVLLQELERALRAPSHAIPASLDHEIVAEARRAGVRIQGQRRRRQALGFLLPAAALAAVALLAALPLLQRQQVGQDPPSPKDDVNQDGRLDILDALTLARAVEGGRAHAGWDRNHDQVADQADVALLALAAVAIAGNGAGR